MFWTISNYKDHCDENEVLKRHYSILEKFYNEKIFCMVCEDDTLKIRERCDDFFSAKLTAKDCIELSKMFADLAEGLSET